MKQTVLHKKSVYSKPVFVLLMMFIVSVASRFLLSLCSSAGPTAYIDEGLYINIARSLVADGKVMYRAQPISYVYLLYPISIMPVFLLPPTINIYRALQLWNSILISTMVFPVYLLSKQAKLKQSHAYLASAVALIIPELSLSTHLVAESIIYPLMMWICLLGYLVLEKPEKRYLPILFGAVNGLAYFAKPECIVFGACFFVVLCAHGIAKKWKKNRMLPISGGFLLMIAEIILGYVLYGLLFDKASALNLYEKQIPTISFENILIMLQGILFHIFAFAISAGNALILIPALGFNKQTNNQKLFFTAYILAIVVMAVAIGIMIVPYNYTGTWGNCPTHLRYLMYFFPILFIWLLLPEMNKLCIDKKSSVWLWVFTVLFIFPSAFNCFTSQAGAYDSPSLNIFFAHKAGKLLGIFCICALSLINAYSIFYVAKFGFRKVAQRMAITTIVLFLALNGAMTYLNRVSIDREYEQETNEVAAMLSDSEFVVFTNNHYDDFRSFCLDAHLHQPAQMIVANNMLIDARETGGIYRSFIPLVQSPNTANLPTIETNTILFDVTTASYVEFTDNVEITKTSNGLYTIAKISTGKPYLKTAIASMDAYILHSSDSGHLLVYDQKLLEKGEVTLHISLRTTQGTGNVTFLSHNKSVTVQATEKPEEYIITLPLSENMQWSINGQTDIIIDSYYTE